MKYSKRFFVSIIAVLTVFFFLTGVCLPSEKYQAKEKVLKNKEKKCEIELKYPQVSYPDNPAAEKTFNKMIGDFVNKSNSNFIKEYRKDGGDFTWSLSWNYGIKYPGNHLISLLFNEDSYQGGAHPNHDFHSFIYDMKNNKRLYLKDFFKPGVPYLQKISQYCFNTLKKLEYSDEEWVKTGTAPKDANYKIFIVDKKGLVIIFPPYQVAAYVAGEQEVVIPYTYLKDIINEK
jgi:hypothetical protein